MTLTATTSLPALSLPLLVAVAGGTLLPALVTGAMYLRGARIALGSMLLAALCTGAIFHTPGADLTAAQCTLAALAALGALILAAPLLDRARSLGTIAASGVGGVACVAIAAVALDRDTPPALSLAGLLPLTLLAALIMAYAGSALLPMGLLRHDMSGAVRAQPVRQGAVMAGWATLCLALGLIAQFLKPGLPLLPLLACAGMAALLTLLTTPAERALAKTGEALCAGLVLALLAHTTPQAAAIAGMAAALCVARSESLTQAVRLDDPLHSVGALLLPLLMGLLLPGFFPFDAALLAATVRLLGFILATTAVVSVILWSFAVLVFGLALPTRLMRVGATR